MSLANALDKAEKGKIIIESIVSDFKKNYVVLVFPDEDIELFKVALKYYEKFILKYEYVYFLSAINVDEFKNKTVVPYNEKRITKEDMDTVIRYLSIVSFPPVKIMSLTKPEHIMANRLIGKKNTTVDDIVVRCLYGIKGII